MRSLSIGIIGLLMCVLAGCHHAGVVPDGWNSTEVLIENGEPTDNSIAPQNNDSDSSGTLQVIICYGMVLSNHTAVRLCVPNHNTLMWDPGGSYLKEDPTRARIHDVITEQAPTIFQWWEYRRDGCQEPVMEVFEWSIAADQANRLRTILLEWHDPLDPKQTFEPDAGGLQCCFRASEFLMRFGDHRPYVPKLYFWPHELGEHLWTQQPDRVLIYRRHGESMAYHRDAVAISSPNR